MTERANVPTAALASVADGARVCVSEVRLDRGDAAWLSAVGIGVGDVLTVVRRAPFGGPLHVATEHGGEFALGLSLAQGIVVEPLGPREKREGRS